MTKPLSDPVFEQLSPLLANIARIIYFNSTCSDEQILTLLEVIDLENEEGAQAELRKWATLLQKIRQNPSADQRIVTIEGLRLCGFKEAQILLAVDIVCQIKSSQSLNVQPKQLEWNNLAVGETVQTVLKIDGGPGQLEVGSDQIKLSSMDVTGYEGEIIVTIKPLSPGSILNSYIRIITASGSLDISVFAEWNLEPDNDHLNIQEEPIVDFGDHFPSIQAEIYQAEPGQSVLIRRGTIYLENPLLIEKHITLIGEGRDKTKLILTEGSYITLISTDDQVNLQEIGFVYEGTEPADCVKVEKGKVNISKCSFQGAVSDEAERSKGAGLRLLKNSNGEVSNCSFFNNGASGIHLGGNCNFRLIENTCKDNERYGIAYFGNAGGIAFKNLCARNGEGIHVREQAQPNLEANTCRENKYNGISYINFSAGKAKENLCLENEGSGIDVRFEAQPRLEANICRGNNHSGIDYSGESAGTAKDNLCEDNKMYGIGLQGMAQPRLEANTCKGNKWSGIRFDGESTGSAKENLCEGNEKSGIFVMSRAPILEANTCRENKDTGISYFGNAAGTARKNLCEGNEEFGITVEDFAQPKLVANTCRGNMHSGISYSDRAAGEANENICEGNKDYGIRIEYGAKPRIRGTTFISNLKGDIQRNDDYEL